MAWRFEDYLASATATARVSGSGLRKRGNFPGQSPDSEKLELFALEEFLIDGCVIFYRTP
jgi:hypothetical protein